MLITEDRSIANDQISPPHFINSPRILCVDDDPDLQTTIELRMREYGVEVEHAFYGMQGLAEAINTHPDVILLDLSMPNGDGQYLLSCIKSNSATESIPVIVLTGMRDPNLKARVLQAGADVYLNKPVHFDELIHHLSRFIELHRREEP